VAPDLGAFAERLHQRSWSWVEPWDQTAAQWLDTFMQMREKNFASGQPPTPIKLPETISHAVNAAAASALQWRYRDNYLTGVATPATHQTIGLQLEFLQTHRAPTSPTTGARSLLLTGIVKLRSHPLLRGVAQRIPQRWQTKVKNWLRA
jgi:O-antigen biosynthesis protein